MICTSSCSGLWYESSPYQAYYICQGSPAPDTVTNLPADHGRLEMLNFYLLIMQYGDSLPARWGKGANSSHFKIKKFAHGAKKNINNITKWIKVPIITYSQNVKKYIVNICGKNSLNQSNNYSWYKSN